MKATDTFKNEFGDTYKVTCDFYDSITSRNWSVYVSKKPKGKRTFTPLVSEDDFDFRHAADKHEYRMRAYLREIPRKWIESVMDDVVTEIRNLCCEVFPKYED